MDEDPRLVEARRLSNQEGEFPAGYIKALHAMRDAAYAYARAHPFAEYQFRWWEYERDMARRVGKELQPGESAAIAASLIQCIDGVGVNIDALGMLRAMWDASDGEGTYMMAKAIVMEQYEAAIERASGQVKTPGDWRCITCAKLLDGYHNPQGEPDVPGPGSYTVCIYCGALQRVKATGDGYRDVPAHELHHLPKPVRMELMRYRNAVLERLRDEAKRS